MWYLCRSYCLSILKNHGYLISNLFDGSSDIYFIGGFGTVAWVDVKEYETVQPDKIAVDGGEQNLKVFQIF